MDPHPVDESPLRTLVAEMIPNGATLKASYPHCEAEAKELGLA